ncbi:unnamed protein product [Pseudo-nitzschia multistriata]|uniref:EngB-type G domain-containing protein n=1 Tax=Pseudo-nitzschia multistriata TaxID=183589 RepID=A0A448ZL85_9STRA|nr:unnamed protein product [Pseudo-nitzschia multistriata]
MEMTVMTGLCSKNARTRSFLSFSEICGPRDDCVRFFSARSRFKQIPVHSSILQYIRRVGVGREGKESRRKKRPFQKHKNKNISINIIDNDRREKQMGEHYKDTMSRKEERQFLANGRIVHRSDTANSSPSNGNQQWQGWQRLSPPPPFGEGQQRRKSKPVSRMTRPNGQKETVSDACISTAMAKQKAPNIRVLPVKMMGRVTSSSPFSSDEGDLESYHFPIPTSGLTEVAIVGRSNVGKSTLVNALLYSGQPTAEQEKSENKRRKSTKIVTTQTAKLPKGLKAKTSAKPGETRSIDFYQLSAEIDEIGSVKPREKENDSRESLNKYSKNSVGRGKRKMSLVLVDLPGYGFAFGPKKEKNMAHSSGASTSNGFFNLATGSLFSWQSLIETYITYRPRSSLKRVLLLIDARHGMKQADYHFLASLQKGLLKRKKKSATYKSNKQQHVPDELPPLQVVLTKCDLVSQVDLARRVVQVRQQLSDCLIRQPKMLPEMLVSAQIDGQAGVLELQKELASLCENNFYR